LTLIGLALSRTVIVEELSYRSPSSSCVAIPFWVYNEGWFTVCTSAAFS
jgi:hypothetical protein